MAAGESQPPGTASCLGFGTAKMLMGNSFPFVFTHTHKKNSTRKKKKKEKEEKKLSFPCCNIFVSDFFFYIPRKKGRTKERKRWLHPISKASYSQDQGKREKLPKTSKLRRRQPKA